MKTAVHIWLLKWFCCFVCFPDNIIACLPPSRLSILCYAKWVCGNNFQNTWIFRLTVSNEGSWSMMLNQLWSRKLTVIFSYTVLKCQCNVTILQGRAKHTKSDRKQNKWNKGLYQNVKPLFYSKAVEVRFVFKSGWSWCHWRELTEECPSALHAGLSTTWELELISGGPALSLVIVSWQSLNQQVQPVKKKGNLTVPLASS